MLCINSVQWPSTLAFAGNSTSSPKSRSKISTGKGEVESRFEKHHSASHTPCRIFLMNRLPLCRYIHLREVMTDEELRGIIDPVGNSCHLNRTDLQCYS